jgi:hypothetical protein
MDVSVTGRSLVQRSPTQCGVYVCDREPWAKMRPWSIGTVTPWKRNGCITYKNEFIICVIRFIPISQVEGM